MVKMFLDSETGSCLTRCRDVLTFSIPQLPQHLGALKIRILGAALWQLSAVQLRSGEDGVVQDGTSSAVAGGVPKGKKNNGKKKHKDTESISELQNCCSFYLCFCNFAALLDAQWFLWKDSSMWSSDHKEPSATRFFKQLFFSLAPCNRRPGTSTEMSERKLWFAQLTRPGACTFSSSQLFSSAFWSWALPIWQLEKLQEVHCAWQELKPTRKPSWHNDSMILNDNGNKWHMLAWTCEKSTCGVQNSHGMLFQGI